ncbi:MAG: hypothetical protein P1U87_22305 [Verrucomicrobiales bacterium]|nr:hypothetical protein [Verrucomicrobiales bacterium]MDF1862966.1 hypothetical protein [Verrucomicrobiales bacterium]
MKPKQLREWLFQNGQEDQWWLCIDTVTEESPLTVAEIEEYIASGDYGTVQALHVSQSEMSNPPWIDVELPSQQPAHSPAMRTPIHSTTAAAASPQKPQETLGIIILLLPLISALLIWFWVGSMNMLQNPGSTLSMLAIGTVIATGVLVGIEASQLGIGSDSDKDKKGRKKTGPIGWAVFTLLLWIIGFPAYLGYRSRYGAKNMVVGGIAVALLFLAAVAVMNATIEEAAGEIRRSFQDIEDAFR